MPEDILEKNAQRHRSAIDVEPISQDIYSVDVGKPRVEARPGTERVEVRHPVFLPNRNAS